jgi:hypothetical protein
MAAFGSLASHCETVVYRLRRGSVVPFLGAGANLCGRPSGARWFDDGYLPSGGELARYLAEKPYGYPSELVGVSGDGEQTAALDLLRVSQWIDLKDERALVEELHEIFTRAYKPTALHDLLADLPRALGRGQLILTTNYDDALEQAFEARGEAVDVVCYEQRAEERRFVRLRDGAREEIEQPRTYRDFDLEQRSVILKIHGAVDRSDLELDTFVVTEDDYIDYLAGEESVLDLIPARLVAEIAKSNLLFLGYALRDWNLRIVLRQIWRQQHFKTGAWAVQLNPTEMDRKFWERYRIDILDARLEDWVDEIRTRLDLA